MPKSLASSAYSIKTMILSHLSHVVRSLKSFTQIAYFLGTLAIVSTIQIVPAQADLSLCNTTASRVGVSIGYKDSKGWATEGWWNVASHTCETLLKGNLIARYYYVHAVDYDRGGEWTGKSFMCTDNKAFTIRGVSECAKRGYKRTGFFEVDTQEEEEWTVRLTDPSENGQKAR